MRPIKSKTYHNMMRVIRMIEAKGYSFDTARDLAHKIFDNYELNSNGLPILEMVARILPADEYAAAYGEGRR
jgi:hypothetical protein